MEMVECPHCFATVVPRASGECPACRKNTKDLVGTDPNLCAVAVAPGDPLPTTCLRCGRHAERRVRISRHRTQGGASWFERVLVLILRPMHLLAMERRVTNSVDVTLPLCDLCAALPPIEPKAVDFENYRMVFVGHRDFRRQLEERRRPRRPATGQGGVG